MKALTLLFAMAVLAVSACQVSSPLEPQDEARSLETANSVCWPEASPC